MYGLSAAEGGTLESELESACFAIGDDMAGGRGKEKGRGRGDDDQAQVTSQVRSRGAYQSEIRIRKSADQQRRLQRLRLSLSGLFTLAAVSIILTSWTAPTRQSDAASRSKHKHPAPADAAVTMLDDVVRYVLDEVAMDGSIGE